MADRRPRILVAGFQHETNTHAPQATTFADFLDGGGWPGLTEGMAVPDTFRALNIPLGGFIAAAEAEATLIPVLWTSAEPANKVETDAFERIAAKVLDAIAAAGPLDAIYLDLHGAMVTEAHDDGESAFLTRIRAATGPDLPIAISLDLHANVSAPMIPLVNLVTIYRSYPHLDMHLTGARAWHLLRDLLATGTRPAIAFRQATTPIPLSAQCTDFGPLAELYGHLAEVSSTPASLSADIALGFPPSQIADARPSLVVHATTRTEAEVEADRLLARLETAARAAPNPLLPPREAVREANTLTKDGGTVVLADVQDNSGAGGMADTTGLLEALVAHGHGPCLLGTLWDPETAAHAHAAGAGATIEVRIGGRSGPEGVRPFPARAEVLRLTDGRFTCTGEMQRGVATEIGPTALLRTHGPHGHTDILISSSRHQSIDAEVFRHAGADPTAYRTVGVKSTVHYRADFAPLCKAILMVETPGYALCR